MFSDPEKNIEQFGLAKGMTVLDFGAGSGFYTFAAAEAVGETGHVYAVDVQKDLLDKLKNEAKNRHLMNVNTIWGDLEHLGGTKMREASVDAVIASNVFSFFEKKDNAAIEILRILKKSGRILLIDWTTSFGGMGPSADHIFSQAMAEQLFLKHGFEVDREIGAGAQHYGIIFRKK